MAAKTPDNITAAGERHATGGAITSCTDTACFTFSYSRSRSIKPDRHNEVCF
jgi:hypothetical protein